MNKQTKSKQRKASQGHTNKQPAADRLTEKQKDGWTDRKDSETARAAFETGSRQRGDRHVSPW